MALVVRELGFVPYRRAVELQEELVAQRLAGSGDDCLLLVEHEPVFTLGRGADDADLLDAPQRFGIEAHRVRRGGGVTYHGPGQMVAYPIVALPAGRRDIRRYVCDLQKILVAVCADFGVSATTDGPHPGVWVRGRKLAAVGIGVRHWVTCHGVALNVTTDVRYFDAVVPCRVPGMAATSLALECDIAPSMGEVRQSFVRHFRESFETSSRPGAELQPAEVPL